jgi:hypothetical protein
VSHQNPALEAFKENLSTRTPSVFGQQATVA